MAAGIDIFDCVAPTRNARHGTLYHGKIVRRGDWLAFEDEAEGGRILIKKKIYALDERPILKGCDCYTCQHYSRAYLHYLFKEKLIAYNHLASIHNIYVMQAVCKEMRELLTAVGRLV